MIMKAKELYLLTAVRQRVFALFRSGMAQRDLFWTRTHTAPCLNWSNYNMFDCFLPTTTCFWIWNRTVPESLTLILSLQVFHAEALRLWHRMLSWRRFSAIQIDFLPPCHGASARSFQQWLGGWYLGTQAAVDPSQFDSANDLLYWSLLLCMTKDPTAALSLGVNESYTLETGQALEPDLHLLDVGQFGR